MKKPWFSNWVWYFWVYLFRVFGLPFHLSPLKLPQNEGAKLCVAALNKDVLIIFNPGGWGDVPVEQASDFAPVLEGIQRTLKELGYRSTAITYNRTLPGLSGRLAGIREQYNSFKHSSQILAEDIQNLLKCLPEKRILVAGFSIGGGLTGRTMSKLKNRENVYGITVGVPGWIYTYSSETSLVLNNSGYDPLCAGYAGAIAMAVFKAPLKWWQGRKNGRQSSIALAIQIPHHEYPWSSPEVGIPIAKFLRLHFKQLPQS